MKFKIDYGKELCRKEGVRLFWKNLKEYYQTLNNDAEKDKILSMIFKDTKKEG